MRTALLLAAAMVLAGCAAKGGEDPFAYTRKPLYTGGFELTGIAGATDAQEFRVSDGSIAEVHVQVWVNASAGAARVRMYDPAGNLMLETQETTERGFLNNLGTWRVEVGASPDAAGIVHILVTRR